MIKDNFKNKIVYIEYKDANSLFNCAGKVLDEENDVLVLGFNFYLGDAIDIVSINKENIVKIKEVSMMTRE